MTITAHWSDDKSIIQDNTGGEPAGPGMDDLPNRYIVREPKDASALYLVLDDDEGNRVGNYKPEPAVLCTAYSALDAEFIADALNHFWRETSHEW